MKSLLRTSLPGGILFLGATCVLMPIVCVVRSLGEAGSDTPLNLLHLHAWAWIQTLIASFLFGIVATAAWNIPGTQVRKLWRPVFVIDTDRGVWVAIRGVFGSSLLVYVAFFMLSNAISFGVAMSSIRDRGFTSEDFIPMLLPECLIACFCGLLGRGILVPYVLGTVFIAAMIRGSIDDILGYGFILGLSTVCGYWINVAGQAIRHHLYHTAQKLIPDIRT